MPLFYLSDLCNNTAFKCRVYVYRGICTESEFVRRHWLQFGLMVLHSTLVSSLQCTLGVQHSLVHWIVYDFRGFISIFCYLPVKTWISDAPIAAAFCIGIEQKNSGDGAVLIFSFTNTFAVAVCQCSCPYVHLIQF